MANQFSYLDGTFVMMFFIFCILDICNIKIRKRIALPMIGFDDYLSKPINLRQVEEMIERFCL